MYAQEKCHLKEKEKKIGENLISKYWEAQTLYGRKKNNGKKILGGWY